MDDQTDSLLQHLMGALALLLWREHLQAEYPRFTDFLEHVESLMQQHDPVEIIQAVRKQLDDEAAPDSTA